MTQADQLSRALETARCIAAEALENAMRAFAGHPNKYAAEQRDFDEIDEALAAYRAQADKQGEAEPVAWGLRRADGLILDVICPEEHESHAGDYTIPLYASPHQVAVPLTDYQIVRIYERPELAGTQHESGTAKAIAIARAIEAAHGIKDAAAIGKEMQL